MLKKIKESYQKASFRTKLILTIESIVMVITIIGGIVIYNNTQNLAREVLRNKLIAIAQSVSSAIDSQKIENIEIKRDASSQDFLTTKDLIKKVSDSDESIDSIYIMEKTDNANVFNFLVDSTITTDSNNNGLIEDEEKEAFLGEEFDISDFPEMQKSFEGKNADYKIACDKWGCWLSGYAPIFKDGKAIAIVGVDIAADQVIAYEKNVKISLVLILLTISILFYVFLFLYLKKSLLPISEIAQDIRKFRKNLSTRIKINRKDEFGLIANNFNKMAREIDDLVKNMQSKVEERTREIELQKNIIETEKNKNESILKSIGDGVFVINRKLEITMFNKTSELITGFSAEEVLGKKYEEKIKLVSNVDIDKKNDLFIQEIIVTGTSKKIPKHTMLINKSGQKIPIDISASPLRNQKQEITGCVIVFRDITHEYEIDKAKTEFVSLASHQLKTPLSSINWYTEMLLSEDIGKMTSIQKKYLKEVHSGNKRMVDLINSLLNVSRLEMSTFLVKPQKTNILKIADDVIKEMLPYSTKKGIIVKRNYIKDLPEISVDQKLIRIIFQNLLSNSLKYTKDNGNVELKIFKDEKNLKIEVSDNGMGIPENQKKNIFSKFFRADNVRQTETEGTGLGLYLVKSIIEHSNGKISFESELNKGTTFFISLPLSGMKAKKGTREISEFSGKI